MREESDETVFTGIKWAIYDWMGSLTIDEITRNLCLMAALRQLSSTLNAIIARGGSAE